LNARNHGSAIAGICGAFCISRKKKSRPLTIVVRKVNGLWLQIREYGLYGCTELSGLRCRVSGLDRHVHIDKKSHRSPSGEWWIVVVPDVAGYLCPALIDSNVLAAVPNRLTTCLGSEVFPGCAASIRRSRFRILRGKCRQCGMVKARDRPRPYCPIIVSAADLCCHRNALSVRNGPFLELIASRK
jgi:hypothetical protein